jgi:hypothetical protein
MTIYIGKENQLVWVCVIPASNSVSIEKSALTEHFTFLALHRDPGHCHYSSPVVFT